MMSDKEMVKSEASEGVSEKETVSRNFIEQIIDKDLAEGVYDTVHTRFPAGTERLSAYRPCKEHTLELRTCQTVWRQV